MLFHSLFPLFLLNVFFFDISIASENGGDVEKILSDIDEILAKKDQLSDEEFHQKTDAEIRKLSKALDDIELSPEEVKKLLEPIKDWSHNLGSKVESLKSNNDEITPEKLAHVIEESIETHPQLLEGVANVLKSKDSSKMKRFFSKIKSVKTKLSQKIKSGWKKVKHFVKTKPLHFLQRSGHVGRGLVGLIIYPIMAIVPLVFGDRFMASVYMSGVSGSVERIVNALFKFHGDAKFSEKITQQFDDKLRRAYFDGRK